VGQFCKAKPVHFWRAAKSIVAQNNRADLTKPL
jgi:hypothetical protein